MLTKYLERRALLAIARGLQDHAILSSEYASQSSLAHALGISQDEVKEWDDAYNIIPFASGSYSDAMVTSSFVYETITQALSSRHDFNFEFGVTPLIDPLEGRGLTPAEERAALLWLYEQYSMEQRGELNDFASGRVLVFLTKALPGVAVEAVQTWNRVVQCFPYVDNDFAPYKKRVIQLLQDQFDVGIVDEDDDAPIFPTDQPQDPPNVCQTPCYAPAPLPFLDLYEIFQATKHFGPSPWDIVLYRARLAIMQVRDESQEDRERFEKVSLDIDNTLTGFSHCDTRDRRQRWVSASSVWEDIEDRCRKYPVGSEVQIACSVMIKEIEGVWR